MYIISNEQFEYDITSIYNISKAKSNGVEILDC